MDVVLRAKPGVRRCAFCHDSLAGALVECPCGAAFHRACAATLRTCSTLGCDRDVAPGRRVRQIVGRSAVAALFRALVLTIGVELLCVFAALEHAARWPWQPCRVGYDRDWDTVVTVFVKPSRPTPIEFPHPPRTPPTRFDTLVLRPGEWDRLEAQLLDLDNDAAGFG